MKTENKPFKRLIGTSLELDQEELLWWEKFAEIEERFCWVQTPSIQKFLRGGYIRRIILPKSLNGRIAELGCGSGWFSILLGKLGAKRVVGFDFSESQIRIATQRAKEAGIDEKVDFILSDISGISDFSQQFDVVLIHGFLHHLTILEICNVVEQAHKMLVDNGRLIIFEPVLYFASGQSIKGRRLVNIQNWLESFVSRLQLLGLAKSSYEETKMRSLISERNVGVPPRGPSPKEMPFAPEELPNLIDPYFQVNKRNRCMARSHLVAQEILLLELSHPWIARLIRWPLLFAARIIERRILAMGKPPAMMWIFEMFECITITSNERTTINN